MAPRPMPFRQSAVTRLGYLINEQLADEYWALSEVEIVVSEAPLTVRSPDVVAAPSSPVQNNPARLGAGDVRLAVEVLSEGTRRTDQVTKFSGVAELEFAGSPLTIDLNALTTRRAQRP